MLEQGQEHHNMISRLSLDGPRQVPCCEYASVEVTELQYVSIANEHEDASRCCVASFD